MQKEHEHPQKEHPQLQNIDPNQTQPHPGVEGKMNPRPDHGEETYKGSGKLKDKIAVVTGGDSGIGKAVCIAFAREGADIVCAYLNEHQDAQDTKAWVEKCGRKCVLVDGDLAEEATCKKIVDAAVKAYGKYDILVNNAAYQGKAAKSLEELDYQRVLHTFQVNIVAMFALSRLSLPHLREGGSIINVGSFQAYNPNSSILDYASTKGAIVTFTKGLAQEVIDRGIRVNCVAPGPIWTPLVVASFPPEKLAEFGKNYPHKRPAMPAEVAPAFVFLASADSNYVAG